MSDSFPASGARPSITLPRPAGRGARPVVAGRGNSFVVGLLSGFGAAATMVLVSAFVGLLGWFLSDAGHHGSVESALGVGTRGWLVAWGAGLQVNGVAVTMLPLGWTLLGAWVLWQASLRAGEKVRDHGPDAGVRADGGRDFTVPLTVAGLLVGHAGTALLLAQLLSNDTWDASVGRLLAMTLSVGLVLGVPAVLWTSTRGTALVEKNPWMRTGLDAIWFARDLLVLWFVASAALFLVALVMGLGDAGEIITALGTSTGETLLLVLGSLLLLPHAVLWAGSFLLGPGFAVGAGTAVAPTGVVLGPLPLLPVLGALPDEGEVHVILSAHLLVPLVLALWAGWRWQRRWGRSALRDSIALVAAGAAFAAVVVAVLTAFTGGTAGPGRLETIGVAGSDVLLPALVTFLAGSVIGAALAWWWESRTSEAADEAPDEAAGKNETSTNESAADEAPAEVTAAVATKPALDAVPAVAPPVAEVTIDDPTVAESTVTESTVAESNPDELTAAETSMEVPAAVESAEPEQPEPAPAEPAQVEQDQAEQDQVEPAHPEVEQTIEVPRLPQAAKAVAEAGVPSADPDSVAAPVAPVAPDAVKAVEEPRP